MATKTAMASSGDQPFKKPRFVEGLLDKWAELKRFLSDVRAEMRKVVAPGRKEVEVTTGVVIITVFLFGVFFFLTDLVFRTGIDKLLNKMGGM